MMPAVQIAMRCQDICGEPLFALRQEHHKAALLKVRPKANILDPSASEPHCLQLAAAFGIFKGGFERPVLGAKLTGRKRPNCGRWQIRVG